MIDNYPDLVQILQDVTEDDSAEFINYIPTAIDLAEERLLRDLDLLDLETKVTGTLVQGSYNLVKPSNYRIPHHLVVSGQNQFAKAFSSEFMQKSGQRTVLKKRNEDYLEDYWPDPFIQAPPKYYGDGSSTSFTIAPTPDASYFYELKYTGQPTKLSISNPTNYFTDKCRDVLYFACMVEVAKFMKAWSQVQVWEQPYQQAIANWNTQEVRKRMDNGEMPNNPLGGNNTLKLAQKVTV